MDEIENEATVEEAVEEETPEAELTEATDWEAEAKKARGIAQRLRTKLTKATEKKVAVELAKEPVKENASKTGELNETQLTLLEVKGISEQEDIDIVQSVMAKTGKSLTEALKDAYVQAILKSNKEIRETKVGIPGTSKRSGSSNTTNLDAAIAKYQKTGELPDDFAIRTQVVNAIVAKENKNKPSWH